MDERVQTDEVTHYYVFNLLPVHLSPKLIKTDQVLHEKDRIESKLAFIPNKRLLDDYDPFRRLI